MLRTADEVFRVPLNPRPADPPPAVMFRRNETYAVWDDRGMTVRVGKNSQSTRLEDIPVSPKAFDRPEILQTLDLIQKGVRTKKAFAISGAKRLGTEAYFLVRWEDRGAKPWMEALVMVDLASPSLHPKFVGRFEGISMGFQAIDNHLVLIGEKLAVVTRQRDTWGLATYDPKRESFAFEARGSKLEGFMYTANTKGLFIERTPYGTTMAGAVDLVDASRDLLYEGRGVARFVDPKTPHILVASGPAGRKVIDAGTGCEMPLDVNAEVRRAGRFVLVWTPAKGPQTATIYKPDRWNVVGRWIAPK